MTGRDPVGRRDGGQRLRYGANPKLIIVLKNGKSHRALLPNDKYEGTKYTIRLKRDNFDPKLSCTRRDIDKVYLQAKGNDGWYVQWINTYIAGRFGDYSKLTTDPGFNMWVDNDEEYIYPYNAKTLLLTNAVTESCLTYIRVEAVTRYSAFSFKPYDTNIFIVLYLTNNQRFRAELEGPMERNRKYEQTGFIRLIGFKSLNACRSPTLRKFTYKLIMEEMRSGT